MSPRVQPVPYLLADGGAIPNSRLPLLVYRGALAADAVAATFEQLFAACGWTGSWRDGIYPFHHYHSTGHEVLGVYQGKATVCFGGEGGVTLEVSAGDVVVIPAGVGHKRLASSRDLGVVGAYPGGRAVDLCRGRPGERPGADAAIAQVTLPDSDPVHGANGPLRGLWRAAAQADRARDAESEV